MLQGTLLLLLLPAIDGGLEPPSDPWELFKILNGPLCECQGSASPVPPINYTQSTDCGTKKAYLFYYPHPEGRLDQCWTCINKPIIISIKDGHLDTLYSQDCQYTSQIHLSCIITAYECIGPDNQTYFSALFLISYLWRWLEHHSLSFCELQVCSGLLL